MAEMAALSGLGSSDQAEMTRNRSRCLVTESLCVSLCVEVGFVPCLQGFSLGSSPSRGTN